MAFGALPLLVMYGLRARERDAARRIVSVELERQHTPRHELRVLGVGALRASEA